jgi:hypothetical protein
VLSPGPFSGFFGAGQVSTAKFADQVQIVRQALAESGGPTGDFAIAKRVYIAVDDDAQRARDRINAELAALYMRQSPKIEAAAIAGTPGDCVRQLRKVVAAGAELVLFTPLFAPAEHAERLAAEVMPEFGLSQASTSRSSGSGDDGTLLGHLLHCHFSAAPLYRQDRSRHALMPLIKRGGRSGVRHGRCTPARRPDVRSCR